MEGGIPKFPSFTGGNVMASHPHFSLFPPPPPFFSLTPRPPTVDPSNSNSYRQKQKEKIILCFSLISRAHLCYYTKHLLVKKNLSVFPKNPLYVLPIGNVGERERAAISTWGL